MANKYRVTILDGGMGRELKRRGAPLYIASDIYKKTYKADDH